MRLYFDLDRRRFVSAPGSNDTLSSIEFKLSDSLPIAITCCRSLATVQAAVGATGILGIKDALDYDGDFLASDLEWVLTGTGDTALYTFDLNLNTVPLVALLAAAQLAGKDYVLTMLELQITEGTNITSSNTVIAKIWNDVIKGTEGTPVEMPDAEDWLSARALRYDTEQTLTAPHRAQALSNLGITINSDGVLTLVTADGPFTITLNLVP